MTDLDLVREILEYYGFPEEMVKLDAHLKEDEERDEAWRHEAQLQQDRYIRLREGVRRWYVNALPEVSEADLDSLLELIEEKE